MESAVMALKNPVKNPRYQGISGSIGAQAGAIPLGFYKPEYFMGVNFLAALKAVRQDWKYMRNFRKSGNHMAAKEVKKALFADVGNAFLSIVPFGEGIANGTGQTSLVTWAPTIPGIIGLTIYSNKKIAKARHLELEANFEGAIYSTNNKTTDGLSTDELHEYLVGLIMANEKPENKHYRFRKTKEAKRLVELEGLEKKIKNVEIKLAERQGMVPKDTIVKTVVEKEVILSSLHVATRNRDLSEKLDAGGKLSLSELLELRDGIIRGQTEEKKRSERPGQILNQPLMGEYNRVAEKIAPLILEAEKKHGQTVKADQSKLNALLTVVKEYVHNVSKGNFDVERVQLLPEKADSNSIIIEIPKSEIVYVQESVDFVNKNPEVFRKYIDWELLSKSMPFRLGKPPEVNDKGILVLSFARMPTMNL